MRDDIAKLLCERQRIGSRSKSLKTGMKLDPRIDYDDDYDWGPQRLSIARRRQHGWNSKTLNENLRPLYQFLDKSVGRDWNDVYSEICANLNPTKAIDFHVFQHLGWHVDLHRHGRHDHRYYGGLYVDDDGILCKAPHRRYERPVAPTTKLYWYDNVWFELQVHKTYAKCGCVHFKVPVHPEDALRPRWSRPYRGDEPAVCIHGNQPVERPIWYVVEYFYHSPDEVFMVHKLEDYRQPGGGLRRGYEKWGLSETNPVHYVYYRDVPEKMKEPIEKLTRRRTANRKHLKLIRTALVKDAGQKAA